MTSYFWDARILKRIASNAQPLQYISQANLLQCWLLNCDFLEMYPGGMSILLVSLSKLLGSKNLFKFGKQWVNSSATSNRRHRT